MKQNNKCRDCSWYEGSGEECNVYSEYTEMYHKHTRAFFNQLGMCNMFVRITTIELDNVLELKK